MMKILIDNNVAIDILAERNPGFEEASDIMEYICLGACKAYLATKSITDIHYTLVKQFKKLGYGTTEMCKHKARCVLGSYLCAVDTADTIGEDVRYAFSSPMEDFEDSIVASVANRYDIDYIVTNNISDFVNSLVKAIKPCEAIELLEEQQSAITQQTVTAVNQEPTTAFF